MTSFEKHLGAALAGRGHTINGTVLAEAVAEANTRIAEARAEEFIARALNPDRKPLDPADTARYRKLMDAATEQTPSLEDFLAMEAVDPNVFWRLDCGHHQNLLDAAIDDIEKLRTVLADLREGKTPALR